MDVAERPRQDVAERPRQDVAGVQEQISRQAVSLTALATSFLKLGATVFGGMWASTRQLEEEMVRRRGWITQDDLRLFLVLATFMPSPKFIGLAGLVGFRLRGWPGSVIAVGCLLLPASLLVMMTAALVHPDLLAGALAPLRRTVGIAVVGILLANAWRQLETRGLPPARLAMGIGLAAAVATAIGSGLPLLAVSTAGLAVGWALLRGGPRA